MMDGKGNRWQRRLALPLLVAAAATCGQSRGSTSSSGIDLGGGYSANLGAGGFSITGKGQPIVATPPGVALVTRTIDSDSPDGWHDPTKAWPSLTTAAIDPATITATSVDDGSGTAALHLVVPGQPTDTALLTITLAADQGFYTGLGEQFSHVSASGRVTPMFLTTGGNTEMGLNDAHLPVPFLVSSNGWGLFVASREAGAFDVASTDAGTVKVTFEGRSLDFWFFVGPDPLGVVARFNRVAGLPRPLPRWTLSPIHWKHWQSTDDVINIAGEYRSRHIPSSALWFDDGWQTGYNTFQIDPTLFVAPGPMMDQLAALGYRVLAWTTPYLEQPHGTPTDEAQQLYTQAAAKHYFVEDATGAVYSSPASPIKGGAGIIDFTNTGAQSFWEQLVARATTTGIRGFKCDYGEDLIPNFALARNPVYFADGTTARTARLYPIEEHTTYHAALDKVFPGDGVLIVRASSWGGATQADIVWPGDLDSSFAHYGDLMSNGHSVGGLPAAVIDLQTLGVSGFPAFGSDTAGYRGDPTPEVELRWMEHNALAVVMQVYEDGNTRLPWAISAAAGAEYQAMATLHQQLEPYNAMLMTAAQMHGDPPIRPLPLAFPSDKAGVAHADDEYMLGPDLLVAPVITAGATSRSVHVPPGKWVHWWTDQIVDGPADVTIAAPLGQPAFFARAGGLVPMLPADIDTLIDATVPGVVTLASRATEMLARAWAGGTSSVTLDDGSRIQVTDAASGVTVRWSPGKSARNLTLDLDTRTHAGGAVTTVAGQGSTSLAALGTAAAVQASSRSAWALTGGHAWIRLVGAGTALAH